MQFIQAGKAGHAKGCRPFACPAFPGQPLASHQNDAKKCSLLFSFNHKQCSVVGTCMLADEGAISTTVRELFTSACWHAYHLCSSNAKGRSSGQGGPGWAPQRASRSRHLPATHPLHSTRLAYECTYRDNSTPSSNVTVHTLTSFAEA